MQKGAHYTVHRKGPFPWYLRKVTPKEQLIRCCQTEWCNTDNERPIDNWHHIQWTNHFHKSSGPQTCICHFAFANLRIDKVSTFIKEGMAFPPQIAFECFCNQWNQVFGVLNLIRHHRSVVDKRKKWNDLLCRCDTSIVAFCEEVLGRRRNHLEFCQIFKPQTLKWNVPFWRKDT